MDDNEWAMFLWMHGTGDAMKLYLFSPAHGWHYCNGATLIVADSLQEAISFGNAAKEWEVAETNSPKFVASDGKAHGCNYWVLRDEFELGESRNKGIIFTEANHA